MSSLPVNGAQGLHENLLWGCSIHWVTIYDSTMAEKYYVQVYAQTSTMADLAPGWEGAWRLSSLQLEVTQMVRKLCEGVHAFIMLGSKTLKANIHPCLLFLHFHANKPSKSTLFYTIIHTCMQVWYLYIFDIPSISRLFYCYVPGWRVKVCLGHILVRIHAGLCVYMDLLECQRLEVHVL